MADNYLITGYWGAPHVTPENDRGINAAIFGAGRFVLPVGEQFRAEYIGNNTIRMYDGKLVDNGAAAGIPAGQYIDLMISEAGQGKKRNDLIVFQYAQDISTLIESGTFVVIKGEETSGTATDPELTQDDLLTNNATFDQMALWRVSVSEATISAPVKMFSVSTNINSVYSRIANAGLGGASRAVDSVKDITANGYYITRGDTPGGNWMLCQAFITNNGKDITVEAWNLDGTFKTKLTKRNDVWGEWEYFNPPTNAGVEYRTTEKWMGKPVYTIMVDCGETKSTTKATNIPVSFNTIIRTAGWCDGNRIPESHNDVNNGMGYPAWYAVSNGGIFTNWNNYPGMQTYVQLWYTK